MEGVKKVCECGRGKCRVRIASWRSSGSRGVGVGVGGNGSDGRTWWKRRDYGRFHMSSITIKVSDAEVASGGGGEEMMG